MRKRYEGGLGQSGWRDVPRKPGEYVSLEENVADSSISPEQMVIVRDLIDKGAKLSAREEALAMRILENLLAEGAELSEKEKATAKRLGLEPPKKLEEVMEKGPAKNPYEGMTFSSREMRPYLDLGGTRSGKRKMKARGNTPKEYRKPL